MSIRVCPVTTQSTERAVASSFIEHAALIQFKVSVQGCRDHNVAAGM